jgi:hypothetical protein
MGQSKKRKAVKKKSLYISAIQVTVSVFGNIGAGVLFILPSSRTIPELLSRLFYSIVFIGIAIYLNQYDI